MTWFHPTVITAGNAACTFITLLPLHMIGDHPVQADADAACKGRPTDEQLGAGANPWTGWSAVLRHVGTYLVCQAIGLVLISVVAPLTLAGAIAALIISGSTHAVIDRRWIVRAIIGAKGGCQHWPEAPYWIDQSLHYGAMFLAAIAAAAVTTILGVVIVAVVGAMLLAGCLLIEAWSAPAPVKIAAKSETTR